MGDKKKRHPKLIVSHAKQVSVPTVKPIERIDNAEELSEELQIEIKGRSQHRFSKHRRNLVSQIIRGARGARIRREDNKKKSGGGRGMIQNELSICERFMPLNRTRWGKGTKIYELVSTGQLLDPGVGSKRSLIRWGGGY